MSGQNQLGRPVYSLQVMLRELSYYDRTFPRLVPDGIFGPETQEAVFRFQKGASLPQTGQVDNQTWDAVVLAFTRVSGVLQHPRLANGLPDRQFSVSPGDTSIYLMMIQSMFNALIKVLAEVSFSRPDGIHDEGSVRNVRWVQGLVGLEETGILGKREWNILTRLYELFLIRALPDGTEQSTDSGQTG